MDNPLYEYQFVLVYLKVSFENPFLFYINHCSKDISATAKLQLMITLMFQNKPKRLCSLAKATNLLIILLFSIMFQLKDVPFRNM